MLLCVVRGFSTNLIKMKKSLADKLQDEINRMDGRCNQLLGYIKDYKENNNFQQANECDIKYRQLKMVSQALKKLLA